MLRTALFVGGSVMAVGIAYEAWVAPSTPDGVLFTAFGVDITYDRVFESLAVAFLAPKVASALRGGVE